MANRIEPLVDYLRKVVQPPERDRLTDGQLLGRFVASQDERAFETIVRRHGPMVFAVCHRLTGNRFDADDAFQATFLVFVRRAASISCRETIGNWLYGVAYRTALHARSRNRQRQVREKGLLDMAQVSRTSAEEWQHLLPVLDRELSQLPDKYRVPVVLCELEGRSRKEVARQLGLPEGTLSSRLATARKLLAKRLAKYGPISGAAVAALLSRSASAALPPTLVSSTVKSVLAGGGTTVAALASGVLKAMFITKLKTVSWAIALVVTVSAGATGYRVALAEGNSGNARPAGASSSVRDELDVMRLEIEALRKDLKITKDRVQTLESERKVQAQAGGKRSLEISQQSGLGNAKRQAFQVQPTDVVSQVKPGDDAANNPAQPSLRTHIVKGADVDVIYLGDFATSFEEALRKVRQNPADKNALQELEKAAKRLQEASQTSNSIKPQTNIRFLSVGDVAQQSQPAKADAKVKVQAAPGASSARTAPGKALIAYQFDAVANPVLDVLVPAASSLRANACPENAELRKQLEQEIKRLRMTLNKNGPYFALTVAPQISADAEYLAKLQKVKEAVKNLSERPTDKKLLQILEHAVNDLKPHNPASDATPQN